MMIEQLLLALQLGDSAYPVGGYAYSHGLETAVERGAVTDRGGLERYVRSLLQHQVGPADAVAAAACARRGPQQGVASFVAVDLRLGATKAAQEPRAASLQMGRRLLASMHRDDVGGWLGDVGGAVEEGAAPGHYASLLGCVCREGGLTDEAAAALVLWTTANALVQAALRLCIVTHDGAQAVLTQLRPLVARLAREAALAEPAALAGAAPLAELWCMQHETAYARLFAS